MTNKENWWKNVVVKGDDYGKDSECYICGRKIHTPLKVHTEKKKVRNSHLSCLLERMESEVISFDIRKKAIDEIKKQILEYSKEIEEEKEILLREKIIEKL